MAIFPIAIFEGPIIIILSGFLTYLGFLNIYIILPVLILGDLVGDSLYYGVGRYGSKLLWVKKIGNFLGYGEKSGKILKNHFNKHSIKTLLIAKLTHGMGAVAQVGAGIAEVDFFKFLLIQIIGVIPKTFTLFLIGFYLGNSYQKINTYLDIVYYAVLSIVLIGLLYGIFRKYSIQVVNEEK